MNGEAPVRVVVRPIGTPVPLGLAGLAIGSFVVSGLDLGWVPETQSHTIGLVLLTVPAGLQLLASVLAYLARDGAAGTAFSVLGTSWLAQGLVHIASKPGTTSGGLGLLLLALAAIVLLTALTVATAKPLPGLIFTLAAAHFVLSGIYELATVVSWKHAAGVVGLVVSGLAAYGVIAFEREGQAGRAVLPTFRVGRGAAALRDDLPAQLDGVEHEAGVRQTS